VRIADLRTEKASDVGLGVGVDLTRPLRSAMAGALERREQVILFLNRRGFAPVLWCSACGETVRCDRCAVSLTLHKRIDKLACHMCGREAAVPESCPKCGGPRPRFLGAGTERIEQLMWRVFPKARVARMDSDTTIARGSHEAILERFGRGDLDILVGTQMIAKGLDIPSVTVVGVVNADATLHIPEFNSGERAFQLVAQVAGRAGRGAVKGEVIVQTALPGHPAITCAAKHDFEAFARGELAERERNRYPPFTRLARVLVEDLDEERVKRAAAEAADLFRRDRAPGVDILGPAPAPIAKIKGKHRWHFLLRCDPPAALEAIRGRLVDAAFGSFGGLHATVDVDPLTTL
jgi:primosomal protein N' (replication factor Y)